MTLYDRIGGSEAITEMVDRFYECVLNDATLRPFFEGVGVERLKSMQAQFFAAALDGPIEYSGAQLSHIHQGMGIKRAHITAFVGHLIQVLESNDSIQSTDKMDIIFRIATYTDQILDGSEATDG